SQPYIIQLIIDLFLTHRRVPTPAPLEALFGAARPTPLPMGALFFCLGCGGVVFASTPFFLSMMVAQYFLSDLRLALFNHVERLPMSFFDRTPIGRLVSRMTTDIDAINEMFGAGSLTMFMDLMTMSGIVAIMWFKSPRLALWALVAIPPLLL